MLDHYRTSSRDIYNPHLLCPKRHAMPDIERLSVNINAFGPQFCLCLFNLCHQFFVCLRNIVEIVHIVAEFEEEIGAEGDECPEWKLL